MKFKNMLKRLTQLFKSTTPSPQEHGMNIELSNDLAAFRSPRAQKRAEKWSLVQSIKMQRGCADCGYNAHGVALQFDHMDEFDKKNTVSNLIRSDYGWDTIMAEIAKCEVVCANCHAIRTKERGQHYS